MHPKITICTDSCLYTCRPIRPHATKYLGIKSDIPNSAIWYTVVSIATELLFTSANNKTTSGFPFSPIVMGTRLLALGPCQSWVNWPWSEFHLWSELREPLQAMAKNTKKQQQHIYCIIKDTKIIFKLGNTVYFVLFVNGAWGALTGDG